MVDTERELVLDYHSLRDDLSSVKTQVAAIEARIDSQGIILRRLDQRASQPTNLVGLGTLVLSLIIAGGTYVNVRLKPSEILLDTVVEDSRENAVAIGRLEERSERNQDEIDYIYGRARR